MAQFMVLQLIGLAVCIMFPAISLWLPHYLFGK
jgi:TRAP-type C4-dicarboxylate transport system permease large subunit